MIYIANAFSQTMIDYRVEPYHVPAILKIERIGPRDVKRILRKYPDFISVYGHERSARWLSELLGVKIRTERKTIRMTVDDMLIVAAVYYQSHAYKDVDDCRPWFTFHTYRLYRYSCQ